MLESFHRHRTECAADVAVFPCRHRPDPHPCLPAPGPQRIESSIKKRKAGSLHRITGPRYFRCPHPLFLFFQEMDASGNLDLYLFRLLEMPRVPRIVLVDDHLFIADHDGALCQGAGIHIRHQVPA